MDTKELVIVVDFGGQYNQLIARRVRENHVYCEVYPYHKAVAKIKELQPQGVIFTGGPSSVYEDNAPKIEEEVFQLGIPVLGLCYGMQFMAQTLGGEVQHATMREFGKTEIDVNTTSPLFKGLQEKEVVWMSHQDYVASIPEGFEIVAHTANCPVAAMQNPAKKLYAMQYHPEVLHSEHGKEMIRNFLFEVCGCTGSWTMANYAKTAIASIKETVGDGKVVLALSGGVDSSVAAALISKAVGSQLTCIFVDHGLLRKNEGDEVESAFKDSGMNFIRVDASERFLSKLEGVSDPERSGKSLVKNLSVSSKTKAVKSDLSISWLRERFIRTSSNPVPAMLPSSRAIITSAAFRQSSISKASSNPFATSLKTKFANSGLNLAFPNTSYGASPSRVRVWPSASWVKSPKKNWTSSAMPMPSSAKKSPMPACSATSISTLPSSPTTAPSASWATSEPMTTPWPCAVSRRPTS
mgnify:CR=1 FL=1